MSAEGLPPRTKVCWRTAVGDVRWGEVVRLESQRRNRDGSWLRTYRVVADTYIEHLVEEADLETA